MNILQTTLNSRGDWHDLNGSLEPSSASLVFAFAAREVLEAHGSYQQLRKRFSSAKIVMLSTAGSFTDTQIAPEDQIVCTALKFEKATFETASETLSSPEDLMDCCERLVTLLSTEGLRHVLVFSDGSIVNGSTLAETLCQKLPKGVTLSGGLAGDGTLFVRTVVGLDAPPSPGTIVAVGLYGESLHLGFGCSGGWQPFGPKRIVTRSSGNVLAELDGKSALGIYKTYLGPEANALPASALRFPLHVTPSGKSTSVVRTILSIDETDGTMTFAGDIPEGATIQFMKASYEDLVSGAEEAATEAGAADLLLCVSCVGRRIVLGQRVEDELECVRAIAGPKSTITGFYSYGELSPTSADGYCLLHNQTMTITSLSES